MTAVPNDAAADTFPAFRQVIRQFGQALNRLLSQEIVREFTLTANAASTTITQPQLGVNTRFMFDPLTANAAAELAAGTLYVLAADRDPGVAIVTHANNGQTDRTFRLTMRV